jgi:hypothetical protein
MSSFTEIQDYLIEKANQIMYIFGITMTKVGKKFVIWGEKIATEENNANEHQEVIIDANEHHIKESSEYRPLPTFKGFPICSSNFKCKEIDIENFDQNNFEENVIYVFKENSQIK